MTIDNFEANFADLVDGKIKGDQAIEFLLQVNKGGYSKEVFAAAIKTLKARMKKVNVDDKVIDICGTGGDKLGTLNVSTASCFVLAACGVKIAKHGNKAISSSSGSADIFNQLGVVVNDNEDDILASIKNHNLSFLFAPLFHASLKNIAELRMRIAKEYGQVTIFNYLGPLLNPANTKKQLIGVSRKDVMQPMAHALAQDPEITAYIVHGFDGMDEITICDKSYLVEVRDGMVLPEQVIDPADYGFAICDLSQIKGRDPQYNCQKLLSLLSGEQSAYGDIVTLNCAFALKLAGKVQNIPDGIKIANAAIVNGSALDLLNGMRG